MKNYNSYTVEDFLLDEDFLAWVQGRSHWEDFWRSFLRHYPEKRDAFRQAEQLIRAATAVPERLSEAEVRKETEKFLERADTYTDKRYFKYRHWPNRPAIRQAIRWGLAAAAVLALVLSVDQYLARHQAASLASRPAERSSDALVETCNDTRQLLRVVLSDSSEVWLSPESRLRYPSQFAGNTRTVYLQGEGSFSVRRRRQPFMVYTGQMVTKVLGTRFVVRAFDQDKKMTVQVLSGKVSVYRKKTEPPTENREVNGLILNANQAAIFEKVDGNLTKTLVANPAPLAKKVNETPFVYDEVPLPVILRELEKSYGIPIQFDEQTFERCKITAVLSSESLYEKLDLLCKASSANYEITDGQIVISRKGYR
ncbi:FecR family protein [Larkinella sp. VNQ87]|uniref:FecR family protein n=1 Tax=Larkinella sp. VNQ87 TaxID=3400921 RepID=UPI003C0E204F